MKVFLTDPADPERIRRPAPPAVFGLPVRTLRIASRWRSPATGALLAAEIVRKPNNLHAHIQRINLWSRLGHDVEVTAAILDLWIVLQGFGLELRRRMLQTHQLSLERFELVDYLNARLNTGVSRFDPRLALPGVVLARPVFGRQTFLRPGNPLPTLRA